MLEKILSTLPYDNSQIHKLGFYLNRLKKEKSIRSFGIFFIHYYIILLTRGLYNKVVGHAIPGNIIYWTIDLFIILAISVLTIRIVQKLLPKYSRNIIGC